MIRFVLSKAMKVDVLEHQQKQISSKQKIQNALSEGKAIAFDILFNDQIIGFAMLREYETNKYFLWNFAIDKHFQGQGLGKKTLKHLILFLKENYACTHLSTTYKIGNLSAKSLYEGLGFKEIEEVSEENEVDMLLKL